MTPHAFAGATERTRRDPWFVRAGEYPGVGSSSPAEDRLPIPPGGTAVRRIVTVVADGRVSRLEAASLVRQAVNPWRPGDARRPARRHVCREHAR